MDLKKTILNCAEGSRAAQESLYRQFSPMLYGVCLKYSKNKTEAEDNLHDSFMTIFSKIAQFKHTGSFEGWIKRITVNTIMQKYRGATYVPLTSENIKEEIVLDTSNPNIPLPTLLQYIQELPQKYRTTFNLYVLDGYTHKEISTLLGTSTGTSKSNLARARNILKEKITSAKLKAVVGAFILLVKITIHIN